MNNSPTATTTLKSTDDTTLFCQAWLPTGSPVAALAIVHGLGEHSARYSHVARYFTDRNYAVFALDLRGHGRSQGARGHINDFQDYLNDVQALITHAHTQVPAGPIFLLGHSMGGLIALVYTLKYPDTLTATVVSGPGLKERFKVPAWKTTLGKVMSRLRPTMVLRNGLSADDLCHDQKIVNAYLTDPLVHDRVTARWYTEFTGAGQWALQHARSLQVPILILHGADDPIVDPAGSRTFFAGITLSDKHHLEYPALLHEILNEPEQASILADIEAWLKPRIPVTHL